MITATRFAPDSPVPGNLAAVEVDSRGFLKFFIFVVAVDRQLHVQCWRPRVDGSEFADLTGRESRRLPRSAADCQAIRCRAAPRMTPANKE
jgi:hypothetical protein